MVSLFNIPGDQLDDVILAIASFLTAFAALISPFFVMYKKAASQHEDNKEVLTKQSDQLETVVNELKPNHGSSTKDAISRIEAKVEGQTETIGLVKDLVEQVCHRVDAQRKDINEIRETIKGLSV